MANEPQPLTKLEERKLNEMRTSFAMTAFEIMVRDQVTNKKYDAGMVGTWIWKYADAAMRGKDTVHRPAMALVGKPESATATPMPVAQTVAPPAPLPAVLDEIKSHLGA